MRTPPWCHNRMGAVVTKTLALLLQTLLCLKAGAKTVMRHQLGTRLIGSINVELNESAILLLFFMFCDA